MTVCGYESPGRNEAYLNRNALAAVIRQDPYRQGYQCIQAVGDWLSQGRLPDNRHLYIASRLRDGAEEEPYDDTCRSRRVVFRPVSVH